MTNALLMSRGESAERLYEWVQGELPLPKEAATPLLDLGCGTGNFLSRLNRQGFSRLTGCDGYDFQGRAEFEFLKANLNAKLPFADGSFAVVTAIEVIEHLENPRHLVREMFRILRPGGLAVVTTPNNESLTSLLSLNLRGFYSAFSDADYPAHISPALEVDLRRIFRECTFENTQVKWSASGRVPGLNLRWQQVSRAIFAGKRFSDQLLIRGTKALA